MTGQQPPPGGWQPPPGQPPQWPPGPPPQPQPSSGRLVASIIVGGLLGAIAGAFTASLLWALLIGDRSSGGLVLTTLITTPIGGLLGALWGMWRARRPRRPPAADRPRPVPEPGVPPRPGEWGRLMPVIVTVMLGGMLVSVLFLGALASSDQSTRRLMLGIVLFSTVATLLRFLWLSSGPAEPPMTNVPTTAPH